MLPARYRGNVGLPVIDIDTEEPFSLTPQGRFLPSDHPLSTLSRVDPNGAQNIMHRLVNVEHRKVSLGAAALAVDLRKAELDADVAKFGGLCSLTAVAMQTQPGGKVYEAEERGFMSLCSLRSVRVTIRR